MQAAACSCGRPPLFWPNAPRAANDVKFTMVVSVLSMAVWRLGFSYLLCVRMGWGAVGVWIAMVIDWVCRVICFVARMKSGAWKTKISGIRKEQDMKLISWNVNGLRACLTHDFAASFAALDADIFSVQETKMQPGQADFAPRATPSTPTLPRKRATPAQPAGAKRPPLAVTTGIGRGGARPRGAGADAGISRRGHVKMTIVSLPGLQ